MRGRDALQIEMLHPLYILQSPCFIFLPGTERRHDKNIKYREAILILLFFELNRNDDKQAKEYGLTGGATLHLVLALRGGRS